MLERHAAGEGIAGLPGQPMNGEFPTRTSFSVDTCIAQSSSSCRTAEPVALVRHSPQSSADPIAINCISSASRPTSTPGADSTTESITDSKASVINESALESPATTERVSLTEHVATTTLRLL